MVASLANSVAAGAGAFLVFSGIAFAFPSGMGGGDVKMAGVLGLLVGFPGILVAIYTAVLIGGTLAIALLLLRKRAHKDSIPFGPFLSLGGLIALLANDEAISGYEWIIDRITGA
jgi:leader peptidase (prepilin peptidase)/N-methyltransferase